MDNYLKHKDLQQSVHEAVVKVFQHYGVTHQMAEDCTYKYGEGYIEAGPDACVCRMEYRFTFSDLKDYNEP
jgi:hypothetical protein